MRNVTVSLPEEVAKRARVRAAELDTSLSALVRQFLEGLGRQETDFERRARLQDEVMATIREFRGGDRLDREKVHERDALR